MKHREKIELNLCVLCERLLFFSVVNIPFSNFNVQRKIKIMRPH